MTDDAYRAILAALKARERQTVARLARALTERCDHCRATLRHSGYIAAGGEPVILTTCPVCDRKDDDE